MIAMLNFNPRSPCGERFCDSRRISIHAPRAGSDVKKRHKAAILKLFQSTLPVRGATRFAPDVCRGLLFQSTLPVRGATFGRRAGDSGAGYFNPRSPCGERRITFLVCCANCCNFNPRSPCGERRLNVQNIHISFLFQSTLPVRGATNFEGCNLRYDKNFNPRSPCGERRFLA